MQKQHQQQSAKGFTLIELLVVIAIIGLLATLATIAYSGARHKGLDTRRKADLAQIGKALQLYYNANGNFIETGSGCGSAGNGSGWFSLTYSGYDSIATCLSDAGFLSEGVIDPSGNAACSATDNRNAYMKYQCTQSGQRVVYVYAKLDTVAQSDTATNGTCCAGCDSSFGMNYYVRIPGQ